MKNLQIACVIGLSIMIATYIAAEAVPRYSAQFLGDDTVLLLDIREGYLKRCDIKASCYIVHMAPGAESFP